MKGDLADRSSFYLTEVHRQRPPSVSLRPKCRNERSDSTLALFFLGDVGDAVRSPVTFCMGRPLCSRELVVDPARHTLAKRAHLQFRLADLRERTRIGDQLRFRLYVDPVPEGLMPLILVRQGTRAPVFLWKAWRVELDAWEFRVTYDPHIAPDSEVSIYLVTR